MRRPEWFLPEGSRIPRSITAGIVPSRGLPSQRRVSCGSLDRVTRPPDVQPQTAGYGYRGVAVVAQGKPWAHS
jgi:hypothetical protein